jgi:peptidoglycan/xylan/chitin deacetylase (PgdA/CDA1 family)
MLFFIFAVVAVVAHVAPFPFLLDGSEETIWKMPQAEAAPTVYLTFDDGPNPTATPPSR